MPVEPFIVQDLKTASDGWNEPDGRGVVGWQTLLSADATPTQGLTAGVALLEPGGHLALHRHDPAELYFLLEGEAIVTIEGAETPVTAGACVFIPGNAEHGIRNESASLVRFLYVFPTDRFADVVYRFSAG